MREFHVWVDPFAPSNGDRRGEAGTGAETGTSAERRTPPREPLGPGDSVLVTGAAGGIGRRVVGACAEAGPRVLATDRVPFEDARAARCLVGDVRNRAFVASCLSGGDARPVAGVARLAAIPAPGNHPEEEILDANVLGSYVVCQEAGRLGARRLVLASSVSAFGLAWADRDLSPRYAPVDEDHATLAVDAHGLSRVLAEGVTAFTTRRRGLPTVALRFPFVGADERLAGQLARVHADPAGTAATRGPGSTPGTRRTPSTRRRPRR